jgi:hypothetical protein
MSEQAIFLAAMDKDPSEHAAFLDEACAGDEALRRGVETLLRLHAAPHPFLEVPAVEQLAAANPAAGTLEAAPPDLYFLAPPSGPGAAWRRCCGCTWRPTRVLKEDSWRARTPGQAPQGSRKAPQRFRARLGALEDRLAPAFTSRLTNRALVLTFSGTSNDTLTIQGRNTAANDFHVAASAGTTLDGTASNSDTFAGVTSITVNGSAATGETVTFDTNGQHSVLTGAISLTDIAVGDTNAGTMTVSAAIQKTTSDPNLNLTTGRPRRRPEGLASDFPQRPPQPIRSALGSHPCRGTWPRQNDCPRVLSVLPRDRSGCPAAITAPQPRGSS